MHQDFRLTVHRSYIQNEGDASDRKAVVELSANPNFTVGKPTTNSIAIRLLDAEAKDHRKSHIGVVLSAEEARAFGDWLTHTADYLHSVNGPKA